MFLVSYRPPQRGQQWQSGAAEGQEKRTELSNIKSEDFYRYQTLPTFEANLPPGFGAI